MQERRTLAALTVARPQRLVFVAAGSAAGVVVADQVTKAIALDLLGDGPVHLFGPFSLSLQLNSGFAFSLGQGHSTLAVIVVCVLVAGLVVAATQVRRPLSAIALGLVIGGALGNLCDRFFRHHGGAVVDFIASTFWPTFNLADSAVVVGCALIGVSWLREWAK